MRSSCDRRREAILQRLEIRRELLRSELTHMRALLHEAREQAADGGDELQDWMCGEVVDMIASGWGRQELADVGIGPELLRELRLDDHPALRPGGDGPP
jgi:hypothetical protein